MLNAPRDSVGVSTSIYKLHVVKVNPDFRFLLFAGYYTVIYRDARNWW